MQVTVPPMTTVPVTQAWTPAAPSQQCVHVSIQYGLDANHNNNVTHRNLSVAASVFQVRVENPYMVPAKIEVQTRSRDERWECQASEQTFMLLPFACPRFLQVNFTAPKDTKQGQSENCEMAVYATPFPDRSYRVQVEKPGPGKGETSFKFICGVCVRFILTSEGVKVEVD